MNIIEVKDLYFRYDENKDTVNGVSFNIKKGDYVSIIGPNGSGKSTLAKLLVGLLKKKSGEIKVFDLILNKENISKIRSKVGIVFQNPDNQFIASTVEDDIAFGLENKNIPTKEMPDIVTEYASKVGMIDYLKKEPSNLSGGQKQRVAIAGVLAMQPEVVIFDEATSMLDPKGRKEIRELILSMKQKNKDLTIISITHDIEEAYQSDYILVMSKGNIILQGSKDEVFKDKDILKNACLSIPFLQEFKQELKDNGINGIDHIDSIEGMVDFLCQ